MYQTASLSTKEEPGPQGLLLAPVPVQLDILKVKFNISPISFLLKFHV